jgi:hypothetical protein
MMRTVFIPVRATGATKGDRKSWWETDNFLTARPMKTPKAIKKTAAKKPQDKLPVE